MNQLGLSEWSYLSDGFEADTIRSKKLIEFGNETFVFYAIALHQCFGSAVGHCKANNVREFRETLPRKAIPECCGESGGCRTSFPGARGFPRQECNELDRTD